MRVHVTALGWLHVIWGAFGLLAGVSLAILSWGTHASLDDAAPTYAAVWLLGGFGLALIALGVAMACTGRAVVARRPAGRVAALALAVVNLLIVPFGTALAIYAVWVLFNDEARREFTPTDTIRT